MNKTTTCLATFLLILSTSAFSDARDTPWLVSWPFFQNAQVPHSIQSGYGDWCIIDEGAHPGLDFGAALDDSVLLPTDDIRKVIWVGSSLAGYTMIFGFDSTCTEGWGIAHLDVDIDYIYPFNGDSVVMNHQALAPCSLYGSAPLHMHLQWVEDLPLPPFPPGLYNPFDYFTNSLSGYDEVLFNHVKWEEMLSPAANRGIWFTPDGYESYTQLGYAPGGPDRDVFQDIVSDAIDIAAAPFSAFQGISDYDFAGVYSVSYEILRQDPISLQYVSAAPDTGNFGQRWLMEMRDELPNGDSPGYRAIFPDGQLPNGGGPLDPDWWYNMNAYIVTNSGALDPASWTTGWDNVWTNTGFVNDWPTGICQGAWDTFLAIPDIWPNSPTQNSEAFFPDGRYAVEVTAVSHGSRDTTGIDTLPVDDLSLPDPLIEGVVVDNFLPHIARVAAYTWDPVADTCHKIYEGYWEDIVTDRAWESESEYLEQLRAELHILQLSNQVNALPSRSVFNLPESFSQSSLEHDYQAVRNRLSREYSDGKGDFEPGCCMDEGIELDPIDQLLAEITRVENQQMFDADRTFDDRVYGYLPMNGMPLVLQVFYSEPTKTNISDRVYFRSYIGPDTSSEYTFRRLSSDFELPLLQGNAAPRYDFASSDTLLDSSNVVYYIYRNLPQYYQGNILLYFGDYNLQDEEGPRDLAGNTMDSDPSTIANTRTDYGPFSDDGYEDGQDMHYSWNPPNWFRCSNTVYGTVGIEENLVATVNLNSMGLANGSFIGDCDYWCGFWMYKDEPGDNNFGVYILLLNLIGYKFYIFTTPYPVGGINYEQNWFSYLCCLSSHDGRYFWMTGFTIDLISNKSTALAYCVDSETGAKSIHNLCTGYCFYGPYCLSNNLHNEDYQTLINEMFSIYCSGATVLEVDSNGVAQIQYSYHEVMDDTSLTVEMTFLSPPNGTDDILSGDIYCTSDIISDSEEAIEILSNPVRETLDVRLIGEVGDDFDLILYDITGRRVLSESGVLRNDESVLNIRVDNLPSGVYLLRMRYGSFETVRTISIVR